AAVVAARRLVAGGAIGEVEAVRVMVVIDKPASYWRGGPLGRVDDAWRADPRRSGGGVVLMNGVHHLDLVRHLTGLEPVRVAGATLATRTGGVGVEEIAGATLSLSNGAVVTLAASSRSAGAASQERIEIDGSLGRLDLPDPYTGGPLQAFLRRSWGELPAGRRVEIAVPARDPYRELLEAFARAVRSGSEPSATGRDGRAALAAALAIYASAASGCSVPVELGTGPGRG
ncbi:MAG TPA: Gfo/Idh/MocA family oxidoreductase, partial [Candidatus Limnocylindrales bacterium]|nr:Gfo/Idh/MocA family oxidoreductase [Candidatus Limnocylindrales bacterium]